MVFDPPGGFVSCCCTDGDVTMTEHEDVLFMRAALEQAALACSLGEVPVGAIVARDGQVISRAHNRRELDQDPTAHAEVLAMRAASVELGSWRLSGCTLYVTLEPCAMCAGAAILARVDRCVFGCFDPKGGFVGSLADLSAWPELNHHFEVTSGVLQEESAEALKTFFRRLRAKR
jgi:tRNA(adenine34) deaminase